MTMVESQAAAMQPDAQRITSLEIAEVTGKRHADVMRAIRNMEQAWEMERGCKFALTFKISAMPNGAVRKTRFYSLTKTESLYVATKFNDMARARLVMRWEELERERQTAAMHMATPCLMLETEDELLRRSDALRQQLIADANAASDDCLTATQVAQMLGISTKELNRRLVAEGIQHWSGGRYRLTPAFQELDLARERSFHYFTLDGEKKERPYLVWTPSGRDVILSLIIK